MYLENFLTSLDVRTIHYNLTIKTAGTQQSRVQNIRTVGSSNHDDAFVSAKAVHFNQQLVQSLFTFVMATAKTCATLTTNCVNLINKYYAGSAFFSLIKQVTNTGSTYTNKHLYEVRTGNAEEGHACFTCNSLCQQGFTSTRRSIEQHAFRNFGTKLIILLGRFKKLYNFPQLLLGLVSTCNIFEGNLELFLIITTGTAFTEVHNLTAACTTLIHQHKPQTYNNQYGQNRAENSHPPWWLRGKLCFNVNFVLFQLFY